MPTSSKATEPVASGQFHGRWEEDFIVMAEIIGAEPVCASPSPPALAKLAYVAALLQAQVDHLRRQLAALGPLDEGDDQPFVGCEVALHGFTTIGGQ